MTVEPSGPPDCVALEEVVDEAVTVGLPVRGVCPRCPGRYRNAQDGHHVRLITPGETAPNSVNKYLLPHEHQVITVRKHPAILLRPVIFAVIGLVLAAVLTGFARHNGTAVLIIWLLWLILLGYLIVAIFEWVENYFVVTGQRMLLTSGLVTRKVAMMPLVKVTDMSFQRNAQGRLLGYGTFILESAGQDQAFRVVDHLPYPEQLYLEVCGLIFPSAGDSSDD